MLKLAKTSTTLLILLYLNNVTRYYSSTKGEFSLLSKLSKTANSEANELLRAPLILSNKFSLNALKKYYLFLNEYLTVVNLRLPKSKRLSDISSTLIREDSRPGYTR